MTAQFTQGRGDVQSPDVSYDGKKIVFSMKCPADNTSKIGDVPACTGALEHLGIRHDRGRAAERHLPPPDRRPATTTSSRPTCPRDAATSSPRTGRQKSSLNQALGQAYKARDEYERETVFNLHTMDADGGNMTQISFNQSHDRSPTVRQNGDIMFSRWDHVGGRNHFKIFRAKPDGTDLFVLYGAHSSGNSFLHPRDMDPKGQYAGFLASDLMPLSRTHEGGGLVFIDAANFSEQNTPANPGVTGQGQHQATDPGAEHRHAASRNMAASARRIRSGTAPTACSSSYTPCEVSRSGVVVPCATLTQAEMDRLSSERLNTDIAKDTLQANVHPSYAIYMFDPKQQTMLIVAAPPPGKMNMHPVAIQPRTEPNATLPTNVDATLAAQGLGLLEVRSVYDTDGLGRMGSGVLAAADAPAGCTSQIAMTAPSDPLDTRSQVADLVKMKDPADPAYGCAPARFIRAVRAIAPGAGMTGMRQRDRRDRVRDAADRRLRADRARRLVQADRSRRHADRPGRRQRTRRGTADAHQLDPGPARRASHLRRLPQPAPRRCDQLGRDRQRRPGGDQDRALGRSPGGRNDGRDAHAPRPERAEAGIRPGRDRLLGRHHEPRRHRPQADRAAVHGQRQSGRRPRHAGAHQRHHQLSDARPPLWTRNRGANTCTDCHNDPDKLDLSASMSGAGRIESYEELMLGDPELDPNTGLPVTEIKEGVLVIVRGPALVNTMASEGEALGLARKSRLYEIMTGLTLMSDAQSQAAHPNPPASAPDHSKMLNAAEKRLVAEWIDLGGKYFNDPFDPAANVGTINGLSEDTFATQMSCRS